MKIKVYVKQIKEFLKFVSFSHVLFISTTIVYYVIKPIDNKKLKFIIEEWILYLPR